MSESSKPDARKVVPRQPTQEMYDAGLGEHNNVLAEFAFTFDADRIWRAMYDAAPAAPAPAAPAWPDGYLYRYPSVWGGTVLRHDSGQYNGHNPIESVPYWTTPPDAAPAAPAREPEHWSAIPVWDNSQVGLLFKNEIRRLQSQYEKSSSTMTPLGYGFAAGYAAGLAAK